MFPKSTLIISAVAVILFGLFAFSPTASAYQIGVSPNMLSLRSGLVGYWTFDGKDMANGVALDKSGNDNHGSPVNIATSTFYVAGKIGQALKFDGVNDYVNVGAPASLNLTNNYTLSMWVRLAGFGGGLIRQSNNSSNGAQYDKYSLRPVSATSLVFATGNGTTGDSDSFNFNMTFDTWTMVTCTLSSSNVKSCYKNGALVGTATNDVDTSLVTPTVGLIGTLRNAAGNFSNGVLDDIRIYNRALSANEIKQLYNLGAGTKQAVSPKITPMASTTPCSTGSGLSCGLIGYWTFDGKDTPWTSATAATTLDKSGNFATGTLTSMSQSTSPTPGKIGQGLNFDGVNDYVNTSAKAFAFERTDKFSIAMWYKLSKPITTTSPTLFGNIAGAGNRGYALGFKGAGECSSTTKIGFVLISTWSSCNKLVACTTNNHPSFGWHHVVSTYDGSSQTTGVKIYIDNVSYAITSVANGLTATTVNNLAMRIGDDQTSDYFRGIIDDVRVYNRVLSANEVTQLYNLGAGTKQAVSPKITPMASTTPCSTGSGLSCGLVGYWTFDGKDMANGVALDKSGNDNHGSPVNIATSTFYVAGKIGQALNFDGVNDSVNVSNTISTRSISFWIKPTTNSASMVNLTATAYITASAGSITA